MDENTTDVEPARSNPTGPSASSEMAQPDSGRLSDDQLVSLYEDDSSNGSSYILSRNLARALKAAGMADVEEIDVVLDGEDPEQPAIVLLPLEDDDEHAINPRKVRYESGGAETRVPPRLLGGGSHPGGIPEDLGLDLGSYDNDDKLLFEPVIGDGFLLLLPERFEGGEPYVSPVVDEGDSDTGVPEPSSDSGSTSGIDAVSSPIEPQTIAETAQNTGVDEGDLAAVLEAIDVAVADVEWQAPVQYQPLDVEDRVVHVVEDEVWTEIGNAVRAEVSMEGIDAILEAAEFAHLSAARDAIEQAGPSELRHFEREFNAILESK